MTEPKCVICGALNTTRNILYRSGGQWRCLVQKACILRARAQRECEGKYCVLRAKELEGWSECFVEGRCILEDVDA